MELIESASNWLLVVIVPDQTDQHIIIF